MSSHWPRINLFVYFPQFSLLLLQTWQLKFEKSSQFPHIPIVLYLLNISLSQHSTKNYSNPAQIAVQKLII